MQRKHKNPTIRRFLYQVEPNQRACPKIKCMMTLLQRKRRQQGRTDSLCMHTQVCLTNLKSTLFKTADNLPRLTVYHTENRPQTLVTRHQALQRPLERSLIKAPLKCIPTTHIICCITRFQLIDDPQTLLRMRQGIMRLLRLYRNSLIPFLMGIAHPYGKIPDRRVTEHVHKLDLYAKLLVDHRHQARRFQRMTTQIKK